MEPVLSDPLLQFRPGTVRAVRALYGLDGPGRMEEAIDLLDDWVKKQAHFKKKDFNQVVPTGRQYLEVLIVTSKGSMERAKKKLDKYCTLRTMIPKFFDKFNVREDLQEGLSVFPSLILPKTTEDYYRVMMVRFVNSHLFSSSVLLAHFKHFMMLCDYLKAHDYYVGCIIVLDIRDFNLTDLLTKMNFVEMNQFFTLLIDAYSMRLKSINLVTTSKLVNTLVGIMKQIVSEKVGQRIRVHKDFGTVFEVVPKDLFPQDLGGKEKPFQELHEEWLDVIGSKENIEYLKMMSQACTDESHRPSGKLNEEYMGVAGTFRSLAVD